MSTNTNPPELRFARLIANTEKKVPVRDREHLVKILGLAPDGHATFEGIAFRVIVPDGMPVVKTKTTTIPVHRDPFDLVSYLSTPPNKDTQ